MKDATYVLKKHRVYRCVCGAVARRPLQAADTIAKPFPVPCESCGRSFADVPFAIEDAAMMVRDILREASQ